MEPDQLLKWAHENRLAAAMAVIVVLIAGGIALSLTSSSQLSGFSGSQQALEADYGKPATTASYDRGGGDTASGPYVQVRESEVEIESENLEEDVSKVEELAESYGGFVEESRKRESDLDIRSTVTVRVPSENFTGFIDSLRQDFEVESYTVENRRVSTERDISELELLNQTLDDYENIRREVNAMQTDSEKLDLLQELTKKELDLKERQRELRQDLGDTRSRSEMSTVEVRLEQQKKVELLPENIGNRARNEVKETVDAAVETGLTTFTDALEYMLLGFKLLVILAALAVPGLIGYRGFQWLRERL